MPFAAGVYTLPALNPVTTATTITSTWANNTMNDLATALTTCLLKDGSQTVTANIPMAGFKFTGLAAGSASGNSVRYEQVLGVVTTAGDTLQATAAGALARLAIGTARQVATVNAGATALAFQNPITLATEQASTSGTVITFGSLPAGIRRITVMFKGVSTNGTSNLLVQIGDSGGLENSGYLSTAGTSTSTAVNTTGFIVTCTIDAATDLQHGSVVLNLENAAAFSWTSSGNLAQSGTARVHSSGGSKSLTAELTQVAVTSVTPDTFDAGALNISYE